MGANDLWTAAVYKRLSRGEDGWGSPFMSPRSVCIDPRNPKRYFVGDEQSIWSCYEKGWIDTDTGTGMIRAGDEGRLIAGCDSRADPSTWPDRASRLWRVSGLLCTTQSGGGDRLIASDYGNHRLVSVDIKTGALTTIAENKRGASFTHPVW